MTETQHKPSQYKQSSNLILKWVPSDLVDVKRFENKYQRLEKDFSIAKPSQKI